MKLKRWLITLLFIALVFLPACGSKDKSGIESEAITSNETSAESSVPEDDKDTSDEETEVTLLDAEAMLETLGNYLLRPGDLPNEYHIPEGGEQRLATIRLIQDMGEVEAKTYVNKTGRIDGWWLELQRSNKADFAPISFESTIEIFDSAKGARSASSPDYFQLFKDETREYSQVAGGCNLGDHCEFYYSEKEDPTTELIIAQYNIVFTYRNAFISIMARGLEFDLDADYVLDAANTVLHKLKSAPTL